MKSGEVAYLLVLLSFTLGAVAGHLTTDDGFIPQLSLSVLSLVVVFAASSIIDRRVS